MSIPPVSSGDPSSTEPATEPAASTPSSPSSSTTDTISSSSGTYFFPTTSSGSSTPWLDPPQALSLIQYANLVGTARINLQSQTGFSDELGFTVNKDMWANAVGNAEMIRDFYKSVQKSYINQTNIANTQQQQSSDTQPYIDAYNLQNDFTGDQAATDTMNQAIDDFNNGLITDVQFNAAVDTYNSYASTHNMQQYVVDYQAAADAYNAQVDNLNAEIDTTNALNAQTGLPLLPYVEKLPDGDLPTMSYAPPLTAPIDPLPAIVNPIPGVDPQVEAPDSFKSMLNQSNFANFLENLLKGTSVVNDKLRKAEAFRNLNQFIHKDLLNVRNPPTESDAFVQAEDKGSTPSASGEAAASGSGFTSLALGLSSNGLPRVLGLNLYIASSQDAQTPTFVADYLALANAVIGYRAGFLSAAPGVLAIGDSSLGDAAGGPSIKVLQALGYASVIRGLITSQQLSGLVGNLLATNGVSEDDLASLTRSITAGFQLSLIEQSIFRIASSLGLPGSVAQILGNLNGIPDLATVLGSAANPNVNDLLKNSYLTSRLADNLAAQSAIDRTVLDTAIANTAAQGDLASTYAFGEGLKAELIKQGVDADQALASSLQAQALVNDELSSSTLDQAVTQSQIAAASQNADLVHSNTLAQAQTARDIRDGLLKQLTIQGNVFKEALAKANELTEVLTGTRLAQEYSAQVLNEAVLKKSLEENLARTGNATGLSETLSAGIAQSAFNSSAEVRAAIYSQLLASGIGIAQAHTIADNALLVRNNADAYYSVGGGAKVQSPSDVAARLQSETYQLLKGAFDTPTAMSVARQLAESVIGSPTNEGILYDDLNRPNSLLNLANDQIAVLREKDHIATLDAVKESFREVMRPTDNLFYITQWQNTPGNDLIEAMSLMNASHGKEPTNYLKSIDIAA